MVGDFLDLLSAKTTNSLKSWPHQKSALYGIVRVFGLAASGLLLSFQLSAFRLAVVNEAYAVLQRFSCSLSAGCCHRSPEKDKALNESRHL